MDLKITPNTSKISKSDALMKTINVNISSEFDEIYHECINFSHELTRSIASAQKFIEELKSVGSHRDDAGEADVFYDCYENNVLELPEPVSFLNLNVGEGVTVSDITDHVTLKTRSYRKVSHFGEEQYSYIIIVHPAKDYPECPALDIIFSQMQENLPIAFTKQE